MTVVPTHRFPHARRALLPAALALASLVGPPARAALPAATSSASVEAKVIATYVGTVNGFNAELTAVDVKTDGSGVAGGIASIDAKASGSGVWTFGGSVVAGTPSSASGSTSAMAMSSFGTLKGRVSGEGSATLSAGGSAFGSAQANASFTDYLQFGAPGGGPVSIRFGIGLEAGASSTNGAGGANVAGSISVWTPTSTRLLWSDGVGIFPGSGDAPASAGQMVTFQSGDILELGASLAVNGSFSPSGSFSVDASNTAEVFFEILTPGASYASASGATYLSAPTWTAAVPEPQAALLLLAGLAVLAGAAHRRRR